MSPTYQAEIEGMMLDFEMKRTVPPKAFIFQFNLSDIIKNRFVVCDNQNDNNKKCNSIRKRQANY